jgi:L-ascorbate metabolism protein UlaG (beta-lactamase superfamily)
VLTDPLLRPRAGPLVRLARPVGPSSLGQVDCILLSHLHSDHVDLPSLRSLEGSTPTFAPRGAAGWLRHAGLREVHELGPGEHAVIHGLEVIATEARHDRRRRPLGPAAEPIGYVVRGKRSAYFPGDTDLFPAMARLRGTIDVALLPVWGWGPSAGAGHLDPERAARAAAIISPEVAIPIHWGTFALGRIARSPTDPSWPARRFTALAGRYAPGVQVRVLAPGQRVEL